MYKHITDYERDLIAKWHAEGISNKDIAQRLKRDKATIGRELRRNKFKDKYYVAIHAQAESKQRQQRAKRRHPLKSNRIYSYVIDRLQEGWSPEGIAGRLKRNHGEPIICHETIYQFIYSDHPEAGRLKLWEYLPRKQKKRRKQNGRSVHKMRIPDRVSIHTRPEEVETREEFGHWEGDSIVGRGKRTGIHTEVERKTRYLKAHILSAITAEETVHAQEKLFADVPEHARRSTTVDNGLEFVRHKEFAIPVYFADPYSSWQRGTNEYHNGLIRRYLPKKTDFSMIAQDELNDIVEELNNRPRKCLGYNTPKEEFEILIRGCTST